MSGIPTDPSDLERLIESIARELMAAGQIAARPDPGSTCACHGCRASVCPDTLHCGFEAGADRIGIESRLPPEAAHLAAQIDHTLLRPDATYAQVDKLCEEALEFGFASVCVNPNYVR